MTNILLLIIAILIGVLLFKASGVTLIRFEGKAAQRPDSGGPIPERYRRIADLLQKEDPGDLLLFVMSEHALAQRIEEIEELLAAGDLEALDALYRSDLAQHEDREGIYRFFRDWLKESGQKIKPIRETLLQKLNTLLGLGGGGSGAPHA
ncbi:hypothetical protein [Pseudoruegeria sp. SHC-113]|uniref:hypothetical protein n=1 Tax=Pseudoruegeria sp. SHC-113 TaxID=2855439 RepID=UPI0021BAA644|nr:hypothetical protein [Pseudoruegeria sp. SHC-113]MCT8162022.1 hypothetical protein [Pseudoruegeria sp. SHC-113]